jgi:hypothetical protein
MKKINTNTHKWKKSEQLNRPYDAKCEKCGCVRYWDFSFARIMYLWGTHITNHAPRCIMTMNGEKPYNK